MENHEGERESGIEGRGGTARREGHSNRREEEGDPPGQLLSCALSSPSFHLHFHFRFRFSFVAIKTLAILSFLIV